MKNDKKSSSQFALFLILAAGVFWGSSGIFVKGLTAGGLNSVTVTGVRMFSGGLLLTLFLLIFDRKKLRLPLSVVPLVITTAICSVFAMGFLYFYAISVTSLSVAAILLYTSPIFVLILSCIFFKEKFTWRKGLALVLALGGCILVAGLDGKVTTLGILAGIGSGFAYALYSIFGKFMLRRLHPFTATAYTFLFAGLFSLPFMDFSAIGKVFASGKPDTVAYLLTVGLITAALPYLCYTTGLKDVEAGRAAILANAEPMVATLFGIFLFREAVTLPKLFGIALIVGAILLLNLRSKKQVERENGR